MPRMRVNAPVEATVEAPSSRDARASVAITASPSRPSAPTAAVTGTRLFVHDPSTEFDAFSAEVESYVSFRARLRDPSFQQRVWAAVGLVASLPPERRETFWPEVATRLGYPGWRPTWVDRSLGIVLTPLGDYVYRRAAADPVLHGAWLRILSGDEQSDLSRVIRDVLAEAIGARPFVASEQAVLDRLNLLFVLYLHPLAVSDKNKLPPSARSRLEELRARFAEQLKDARQEGGRQSKLAGRLVSLCTVAAPSASWILARAKSQKERGVDLGVLVREGASVRLPTPDDAGSAGRFAQGAIEARARALDEFAPRARSALRTLRQRQLAAQSDRDEPPTNPTSAPAERLGRTRVDEECS